MAAQPRSTEEAFNHGLAEALQSAHQPWSTASIHVEQTRTIAGWQGKHPDILILDDSAPPIVIECSYDPADAHRDAVSRLGLRTEFAGLPIRTACAVHIPGSFRRLATVSEVTETLIRGGTIGYALHQEVGLEPDRQLHQWPSRGFLRGEVHDLTALLPAAAQPKESVEAAADEVAQLVDQAAQRLDRGIPMHQQDEIAEIVLQRTPLKRLRTAMVLWLDALLTQQRLATQQAGVKAAVNLATEGRTTPSDQATTWRQLLVHNWRAIFEPAVRVLERFGSMSPAATSDALQLLREAVEKIETERLGLHINVGAELFPKLSDDRKQAAAFYTQPATAELLAELTIRPEALPSEEWRSSDLFLRHSLADLACGTGTLLRAGYRRIASLHRKFGGGGGGGGELHRAAMENGLVGTDVNPIAAHLTSSSLAAIGEGEPYGNTRIGWVDVGGAEGKTGSIEYFERAQVGDLFTTYGGRSTGDEPADKSTVDVPDGSFRWLLMNPPYSRTRGGQSAFDIAGLTESERKQCQRRWGKLVKDEPTNRKAGMGATYLALAARKVKAGGRIGFVLPLTAAFAESWAPTRQMIEREFEQVVAIAVAAGQALGRDALSADTGMEEMLLVATKRDDLLPRPYRSPTSTAPIRCVTLRRPLSRLGEAGEIGRAIMETIRQLGQVGSWRPIRAGDDELGTALVFDAGGEGGPWGPLGAMNPDLALAADALTEGRIDYIVDQPIPLPVPMSTLNEVFDVGPTHHEIGHRRGKQPIGAFEFHPIGPHSQPDGTVQTLSDSELALAIGGTDAIGRDRALWSVASKLQKRLLVGPTHKGVSPAGVGSPADREEMRARKSDLFYSRNMRWTSQALLAASSVAPLMGGRAWTTLAHSDPRVKRACALWVNSIFGMVVHWTQGQRTHAGRSTAQIDALKQIPAPRLDLLDAAALERATALFEELQTLLLAPACRAHADPTRAAIDEAVVSFLGLPQEAIDAASRLRLLWCSEPSVHGWNRKALSLLQEAGMAAAPRD